MSNTTGLYVQVSETLYELLEARIDELDVTKRDYIEQRIREDTEHITLDDPRARLADVEQRLSDAQEQLESVREEEADLREDIKTLRQKQAELEKRVGESGLITAGSYDEAVDALIDVAVDEGIYEGGKHVDRVAEQWGRDSRQVCRDVYERGVAVVPSDVGVQEPIPRRTVPDTWATEWPDEYGEAVQKVASRILDHGVLHSGLRLLKGLQEEYEIGWKEVGTDVFEAMGEIDIETVDVIKPSKLSPEDAPDADLVLTEHYAEAIGAIDAES